MTKRELVRKVQDEISDYPPKDIAYAVYIIFESMSAALVRNERIEIRGFGNFTVRNRKQILGRNPKTSAVVRLPARKVPFFKVGKELNEMINR
ncbi:MAG TPA: HU family DNA-binding protein [Syntrophales bacterium]|nr:HU family DNA-binding protein [Syntrophales bacterium]